MPTRSSLRIGVAAAIAVALIVLAMPPGSSALALTSGGWTTTATASPSTVRAGDPVTLAVSVTSNKPRTALVDLEVYSPTAGRVHQRVWDAQAFSRKRTRSFSDTWTVPSQLAGETLVVKVGIFAAGWGSTYHWNDAATTFTVASGATTTTAPPSTTTTAAPTTTTTAPTTTTTTAPTTTTTTTPPDSGGLPARPAGWPASIELGMADAPGGASALAASVPVEFRYQYLAGGVNTGNGWANWNANGDFVRYYIEDSRAAGITPVFTYYMLYQSNPGATMGEADGVAANLGSSSTMAAYFADLRLFFQKAAAAGGTTVLHVEPDMWAYIQQRATNRDAATVPVRVAATGMAELAGLPDNAAGLGQAIVRLRDLYAPNVDLGFHFSTWGTGNDFIYSDPSDSVVESLGTATAQFYRSLNARFDVAFTDLTDRDAAFKQYVYGDRGASWYTPDDYRRSTVFIGAFVRSSGLRAVIWQIPFGNTRMQAMNNTWNHYQDNKVEWLLDEPARTHLDAYADAGVIALLFGRGADGVTCACDANRDGVTNPAPINGNTGVSLSADDDGGFFRDRANAYLRGGAVPVP